MNTIYCGWAHSPAQRIPALVWIGIESAEYAVCRGCVVSFVQQFKDYHVFVRPLSEPRKEFNQRTLSAPA